MDTHSMISATIGNLDSASSSVNGEPLDEVGF